MRKIRLCSLLITAVLIFASPLILLGQSDNVNRFADASHLFETLMGPDHDLVNGRVLIPARLKTYGHPYMGENEFSTGKVTIKQRQYNHVGLKYDILDQQLILQYVMNGQAQRPIILNKDFVEHFSIKNKTFVHKALPELGKKYYQLISGNSIKCFYYFYKDSEEKAEGKQIVKEIRPQKVNRYLQFKDNGACLRFKSNRSFLRIFDEPLRTDIKKYLASGNLNLKIITDDDMQQLLVFCEKLIQNQQ